jgi:hypothetical protein
MSLRTTLLTVIGAGCVVAAGAGGFLAVQLTPDQAQSQAQASTQTARPAGVPAIPVPATKAPVVPPSPPREVKSTRVPVVKTPGPIPVPQVRVEQVPPVTAGTSNATVPPNIQPPVTTVASTSVPSVSPTMIESPKPQYDEVTLAIDSVIGIRLDGAISTETAKIEDKVTAHVSRDVRVGDRTAIPAGTKLEGYVTVVERGGKFKDRARLGVRFSSLILTDNLRVPIQTETIFRDGQAPTREASSKIGAGAVVGTILGAVIGGKKGAAIGATAGAAGGTAVVMAGDRNEAVLANSAPLTVRLTSPVTLLIERQQRP